MNKMIMKEHSIESVVTYVFTLNLTDYDHTKFNFNIPWHGLQMSLKGPHLFMVMVFGHSVKWPLLTYYYEVWGSYVTLLNF